MRSSLALALIAALLAFQGCAAGICARRLFGETLEIKVNVDPQANDGNPLAMDVVYVYDEDLFRSLLQMSAEQWFAKREELRRTYPDHSAFEAFSWEWLPNTRTEAEAPLRASAVGGIIFVNYFNEGPHRVRIQLFRDIDAELGLDDVTVVPL